MRKFLMVHEDISVGIVEIPDDQMIGAATYEKQRILYPEYVWRLDVNESTYLMRTYVHPRLFETNSHLTEAQIGSAVAIKALAAGITVEITVKDNELWDPTHGGEW